LGDSLQDSIGRVQFQSSGIACSSGHVRVVAIIYVQIAGLGAPGAASAQPCP
jgi:hypothetical protein